VRIEGNSVNMAIYALFFFILQLQLNGKQVSDIHAPTASMQLA
jgi:hypothetical protein